MLVLCLFCFFIPVNLCASIFHEFPSLCLCHRLHRVKWPGRGGKCHRKIARKGGKKTQGKNKREEQESDYQPFWEQKEEKLCIQLFSIYLEREVADEKCFRRRQTFLVELIQTVISTIETRHRQTSTPSISYLHFFSSVLLHYSIHVPRLLMYTKGSSHATSVLVPPDSSLVVMGRRKGRINNVIGPVIGIRGEWNWRQFSFSGIMYLEVGWCQSSWCHWGWLWFDPRSLPVVFAPTVPADVDKYSLINSNTDVSFCLRVRAGIKRSKVKRLEVKHTSF